MGTPTYGFDNVGDGITVGTYRINVSGLANSNYAITYSSGTNRGLLTITTRAVVVTADPQTKVYGDSDPALTYQITSGSLAFSDAFTGALTRDAGEDVGTYAITQGTLALSSNYALSYRRRRPDHHHPRRDGHRRSADQGLRRQPTRP